MTHPLIRSEIFIETAFEKRFQAHSGSDSPEKQ